MGDLTKEQFEQLPDFVKNDYQDVDGVYKHAGVVKLKSTLNDLDSKLKTTQSQFEELNGKMSEYDKNKQAEIEAARAKALEEARSKGDVETVEKRYQEQMADLEKRVAAKTREDVSKEFTLKGAQAQAQAELSDIVSGLKPVDDEAADVLKATLRNRQQVAEDGKIIYLNEDGSASTLDKNGFIAELKKAGKYKRLRQAEAAAAGGGLVKGGLDAGGSLTTNEAAQAAKKKGDLKGFLQASIKL